MVCRYNEPVIMLQVKAAGNAYNKYYLIREQSSHSNNTPEAYLSIVRQQDTIVTTK